MLWTPGAMQGQTPGELSEARDSLHFLEVVTAKLNLPCCSLAQVADMASEKILDFFERFADGPVDKFLVLADASGDGKQAAPQGF